MTVAARPVYFQRQHVAAEVLNALFDYDAAAWREHNLSQHGCGVVCGLAVHWVDVGKTVRVTPGYAVGPQGDDCEAGGCDGCESAVYIAIRYTTEDSCLRPIPPERCATKDDCLPVRVRDSFEIRCRPEKPQSCEPRMDFEGCSAHALLLGLLMDSDEEAMSRLFACRQDTGEEWLILATIIWRPDERGRLVPELNYGDRAYLPSTQYLLDLLRILGAQTLKKQALRAAILRIDGITGGVLRLNRGRILGRLPVTGRGFSGAQAVYFEPAATPDITAQIVPGSVTDESLLVNLQIPVDTPIRRLSLVIELNNGLRISGGAQQSPISIELINNPMRGIPAIRTIDPIYRPLLIARLESAGLTTAQSVVSAGVNRIALVLSSGFTPGISIPRWEAFRIAHSLISSAVRWLEDGAP